MAIANSPDWVGCEPSKKFQARLNQMSTSELFQLLGTLIRRVAQRVPKDTTVAGYRVQGRLHVKG